MWSWGYVELGLCGVGAMWSWSYVELELCGVGAMWSWGYVELGLCGVGAMCSWGYVELGLCGVGAMWSWGYVELELCGVGAMWSWGYVELGLCGVGAMWSWGYVELGLCGVYISLIYQCQHVVCVLPMNRSQSSSFLQVVNGPKLPIILKGSAVGPPLHFSFTEYNFGPCILYKMTENPIPRSTLVITNNGEKELTVHCLYESQPHLVVQFKSTVLEPGRKTVAIIEFKPQKVAKHHEVIIFEINGCFHKVVTIKGEGAKMNIELANSMNKTVNFGMLQMSSVGKIYSRRTVKIVNHSPTDLRPTLAFSPSSSVPALQQEGVITIEPMGGILLRANGGVCNITVTFSPRSRIPRFSEPVKLECLGFSEPLFVLIGSCQGIEITLDTGHIPFGAVVQDSSSSRKICMMNTGDIGAAFSWETEAFGPEFSISPKEGYISSGKQVRKKSLPLNHFENELNSSHFPHIIILFS